MIISILVFSYYCINSVQAEIRQGAAQLDLVPKAALMDTGWEMTTRAM